MHLSDLARRSRILRWGYPYMVIWAIGIHLNTGIFMLLDHRVAGLLPFIGLREFTRIGLPVNVLGVSLIVVAVMAAYGLAIDDRAKPKQTLLFLLPQYSLMIAAILSDGRILIEGAQSATGARIAFTLVEPLTFLIMFAAVLHTFSIIEKFVIEPREQRSGT